MKKLLICVCVSISLFIAGWDSSFAQQPQYYNYNTLGSGSNSFPFNIASGKQVQLLYLPGDFNQPTPAPAGTITSISFMIAQGYPLGPWTYTDFTIKMGQSSITSFDSGSFYTGPLVTVYHRASVSLTGTAGQWMTITLDTPFDYNPAQSLIVDIGQCGAPGATGWSASKTTLTGNRRLWSVGGCPFVAYNSTDASVYYMGFTMTAAKPVPGYMYYKFDAAGNQQNYASTPVGNNPAVLTGLTIGGAGQFGTALQGNFTENNYLNTGWATSLPSTGWTISLWLNNIPSDINLYYLFGDPTAASFRCFLNGAAGAGNLFLRGEGLTDVLVTGVAPGPTVVTFVYTGTAVKWFKNGVLGGTVAQPTVAITGTGPFVIGAYSTLRGMPVGGLMDEFRMYDKALSDSEVALTWNQPLPFFIKVIKGAGMFYVIPHKKGDKKGAAVIYLE